MVIVVARRFGKAEGRVQFSLKAPDYASIAQLAEHRLCNANVRGSIPRAGTIYDYGYKMNNLKMYCVVSKEALAKMNGNRGKFGTQCGHAHLHTWWDAFNRFQDKAIQYQQSGVAFKITLVADTDEELKELEALYKDRCGVSLVTDAARTVFTEPTITCLGIGPIDPDDREEKLKGLKPLL